MKFKICSVLLFILTLCSGSVTVFFFEKNKLLFTVLFLVVTLLLLQITFRYIFKLFRDIYDFLESIRYRDFSKRYPETGSRQNNLYKYFNTVSETFLTMLHEKEAQQQYLKQILELVNTGILAYNVETLDTLWINDAFKNMFQVPYVKNINWLKKRHPALYEELRKITLGENHLATINTGNRSIRTLINASTFKTNDKTYMLIAFHNVNTTLEEVESSAWKGLLNVMTHEIMNSIAPVASLADTLKKRMEIMKKEIALSESSDFEDMESAMETIRRRSEGLLRFADTYRNLSKNIVPEIYPANLHELLKDIFNLMQPSLKNKGIRLEVRTDNTCTIANIDRNLIEQVLINFITNATYAVKGKQDPQIILLSGMMEENPYIAVADNGCGISPEIREKIFIPFFSTKKTGTGIGLSLSRKIVKIHNGNLQVQSREGYGSTFTVVFNKNRI
jgi:nitrogen fixation/metabolism regulation signal transduction histidine kinase